MCGAPKIKKSQDLSENTVSVRKWKKIDEREEGREEQNGPEIRKETHSG